MKTVPIQYLKKNLSSVISEASVGERVMVLKHQRPVAVIGPVSSETDDEHTHHGDNVGKAQLRPLFRNASRGRYLDVLTADRQEK